MSVFPGLKYSRESSGLVGYCKYKLSKYELNKVSCDTSAGWTVCNKSHHISDQGKAGRGLTAGRSQVRHGHIPADQGLVGLPLSA